MAHISCAKHVGGAKELRPVVFVVDDELSITEALKRLIQTIGFEVLTFSSAQEFLSSTLPDAPGCLVLDVVLPDLSGLDLQEKLREAEVGLPIVFIAGCGDIRMSVRAMKSGAIEFLTKPFQDEELLAAVQLGVEQHSAARHKRAELCEMKVRYHSLTPRQSQVFLLVTTGMLNKQIAAELGTSEKTIKIHRAEVMRKMDAASFAELVRMAQELKLGKATPS